MKKQMAGTSNCSPQPSAIVCLTPQRIGRMQGCSTADWGQTYRQDHLNEICSTPILKVGGVALQLITAQLFKPELISWSSPMYCKVCCKHSLYSKLSRFIMTCTQQPVQNPVPKKLKIHNTFRRPDLTSWHYLHSPLHSNGVYWCVNWISMWLSFKWEDNSSPPDWKYPEAEGLNQQSWPSQKSWHHAGTLSKWCSDFWRKKLRIVCITPCWHHPASRCTG